MCTAGVWNYRWQPLTVHVNQLGKGHKRDISGCAQPDTVAKDSETPRSSNN
jgi:hypothetical protein